MKAMRSSGKQALRLVAILLFALTLSVQAEPLCAASSSVATLTDPCGDMPGDSDHDKAWPMQCAIGCAVIAAPSPAPVDTSAVTRVVHLAARPSALVGIREGPAPPPPRWINRTI